ncbi:hypothetical protein ElyMa_005135600 [Elysia marginata]|uniref:Uncharacterized protein n=1 Tax=Elysia marginata TaxID=1093978 RepID=A0AAV4JLB4_9GAST|nr:hypothetical protein ElyMa_005135600 [Elysia marginata]
MANGGCFREEDPPRERDRYKESKHRRNRDVPDMDIITDAELCAAGDDRVNAPAHKTECASIALIWNEAKESFTSLVEISFSIKLLLYGLVERKQGVF